MKIPLILCILLSCSTIPAFAFEFNDGTLTGIFDSTRIIITIQYENQTAYNEFSFDNIPTGEQYSITLPELENGKYILLIREGNIGREITDTLMIDYGTNSIQVIETTSEQVEPIEEIPAIEEPITNSTEPLPVEVIPEQIKTIPSWVKVIFGAYANDSITENELIEAIKFLIKHGIIILN